MALRVAVVWLLNRPLFYAFFKRSFGFAFVAFPLFFFCAIISCYMFKLLVREGEEPLTLFQLTFELLLWPMETQLAFRVSQAFCSALFDACPSFKIFPLIFGLLTCSMLPGVIVLFDFS